MAAQRARRREPNDLHRTELLQREHVGVMRYAVRHAVADDAVSQDEGVIVGDVERNVACRGANGFEAGVVQLDAFEERAAGDDAESGSHQQRIE